MECWISIWWAYVVMRKYVENNFKTTDIPHTYPYPKLMCPQYIAGLQNSAPLDSSLLYLKQKLGIISRRNWLLFWVSTAILKRTRLGTMLCPLPSLQELHKHKENVLILMHLQHKSLRSSVNCSNMFMQTIRQLSHPPAMRIGRLIRQWHLFFGLTGS